MILENIAFGYCLDCTCDRRLVVVVGQLLDESGAFDTEGPCCLFVFKRGLMRGGIFLLFPRLRSTSGVPVVVSARSGCIRLLRQQYQTCVQSYMSAGCYLVIVFS